MLKESLANLQKASDALGYEYGTFQDAAFIAIETNSAGIAAVRNVALDSAIVHLRILLDFFYVEDPKKKSEYILAEHFFDDPTIWRICRNRGDELDWTDKNEAKSIVTINQLIELSNRWVAHLAWSRLRNEKPTWRLRSVLLHLDALMASFVAIAQPKALTMKFADRLQLPPTAAGIVSFVKRYSTALYEPQLIDMPSKLTLVR